MAGIREILQTSLQGKYNGFSYRVAEVPYHWTEDGFDVGGRFFYLTFQNGVPSLEEFVTLLHGQLVPYCIPRRIRDAKWAAWQSDDNWRHPAELLRQATKRNINISICRQDKMLQHLLEKIQHEGPESVIPLHPLTGAAYNSLLAVFGRIAVYFEHNSARSYVYFTRLAFQWMRGSPLARIVGDAYDYDASHRSRGVPNVATVIPRVMREIERDLRFRYVKYTSCYSDLLREALSRTGYEHEAASLPMLPLYLELGASSDTMVSLMGLGLMRTTAGVVANRAFRSDMDRAEAERWLRQQPWESMGISPICVREIRQLIG